MNVQTHTSDASQPIDPIPHRELGESWTANVPENAWQIELPCAVDVGRATHDTPAWHIVRSRSRQEKLIAEFLESNTIGFFMPMVKVERQYAHRVRVTDQPLFHGYVFLFGTRDDTFRLLTTKRATQVLRVPNQHRFAAELSSIRRAIDAGQTLELFPGLRPGTHVRVTKGAMTGLVGVIVDESRPGWLHLQVHVLGQSACVEVHPASLEPIDVSRLSTSPIELKPSRPGGLSSTVTRKPQTA